jgi:hypothetical protein
MRTVDRNKFFASIVNLDKWQVVADLRKLKKGVQREASKLSGTATVNAFNYFDLNYIRKCLPFVSCKLDWLIFSDIELPGGILQPPFFTHGGPASINFGAIGKTIGHEIIHGFDDEGKQYDSLGNLRDWWSSKTERSYDKKSQCFINEYDKFREPTTGLMVNGVDTQGENLADNGGLRMAFKVSVMRTFVFLNYGTISSWQAYKNYLTRNGDAEDPLLPGKMSSFTNTQLFFMSFASVSHSTLSIDPELRKFFWNRFGARMRGRNRWGTQSNMDLILPQDSESLEQ